MEFKMFTDEGISGAFYETRPGLISALSELQKGDYFVVASLSRMSRTVSDALQISDIITERNANLMVLDINLDMSTPGGRMLFTVLMSINQMERENIAQKVSDNMQNLSNQGKLKPKPPFGYKFVGKNLAFEKDEKEQEAIVFIRRMVNEDRNITVAKLCDLMNRSVYTCRKAKQWYHCRITKILQENDIVIGRVNVEK